MNAPRFTQRQIRPRDADSVGRVPAEGAPEPGAPAAARPGGAAEKPGNQVEIGGPKGPDPTRYGDWELKGRCIDF